MDEKKRVYNENPILKANFISKLFISWVGPILSLGHKRVIEQDDLYKPVPWEETKYLTDKLEKLWNKELTKKKPNFGRAISKLLFWKIFAISFLIFIVEILRIVQPLLMSHFLKYFSGQMSFNMALIYGGSIAFSIFLIDFVLHQYNYAIDRYGMRLRIAACGLLYRKALKINVNIPNEKSDINIINLFSNDSSQIETSIYFVPYIIVAPLEIIAIILLFISMIDYSILSGFAVLAIVFPLQSILSRVYNHYKLKVARMTDERINVISELLTGIRAIKMYCWEIPFKNSIKYIRKKELKYQAVIYLINSINNMIDLDFPTFIIFASIAIYTHFTNKPLLTAYVVFVVAYYNRLCGTMGFFFVRAVTALISARISASRMKEYLFNAEVDAKRTEIRKKDTEPYVEVKNLSCSWNESVEKFTLKDISFKVKSGELLAFSGSVGSGKTSLFMAMLGEIPNIVGDITINGSVFYVTQEPWIFSASLKQNILFGKEYIKEKFDKIIDICALYEDLRFLPYRENTIIGDKGINLSGGQRARVGLARALYYDPDIYLFDDPLSAVDANVANYLLDRCINGYLKTKVRILITHQTQFLKDANQIIIFKNGEIEKIGTFNELYIPEYAPVREEDRAKLPPTTPYETIGLRQTTAPPRKLQTTMSRQMSEKSIHENSGLIMTENEIVLNEYEEKHVTGVVGWKVYKTALKATLPYFGIFSLFVPFFILTMFFVVRGILIGADSWVTHWANVEEKDFNNKQNIKTLYETCLNNTSDVTLQNECENYYQSGYFNKMNDPFEFRKKYFYIHSIFIASAAVTIIIRSTIYYLFFLLLARNLHKKLLTSIIQAKARFFDLNPIGRILNRFSKDFGNVDNFLPNNLFSFLQCAIILLGSVTVPIVINYLILIPLVPIIIIFLFLRKYFITTSREIKRIEGIYRSPLYIHVANTLAGITTIRACNNEDILIEEFNVHSDYHTQPYFAYLSIQRWFAIRLDAIASIFCLFAILGCVIFRGNFLNKLKIEPGQIVLLLVSLLNIMSLFQWTVRQSAEVENLMTSIERIIEYTKVEGEELDKGKIKPPPDWPQHGELIFDSVSFAYDRLLPYVLKDVTLKIHGGEKIGIVGRTASGKTTFFQALYRIAEPIGNIYIDGINTKDISLHDLRNKIAIIPQEPTLFLGTVRSNLDPFNEHDDKSLWDALENVQLKETIDDMKGGLDATILKGGVNLSIGQKQLFCLARAILKKCKILIIDEATANVDIKTEALVQKAIRRCFKDCTIITIAHRLQTVMNNNRIICLSNGQLANVGTPYELLQDRNSVLFNLIQKLSSEEAERLYNIAKYHQESSLLSTTKT